MRKESEKECDEGGKVVGVCNVYATTVRKGIGKHYPLCPFWPL